MGLAWGPPRHAPPHPCRRHPRRLWPALAAHDLGTTLFASTGKDGYCGTSVGLLACVDPYLAAGNFTVAHVNWGMRDIAWKMYAKVTRGAYAAHMETLYWKLRSSMPPNATIIWATTTPVPPSYDNRKNSDVLEVNDIIRSLFGPAGKYREVIINDQYGTLVDACAVLNHLIANPDLVDLPKPLIPEPNINPSQMLRTLRTTYNGPAYNRALHMQSMEMLPPMSG